MTNTSQSISTPILITILVILGIISIGALILSFIKSTSAGKAGSAGSAGSDGACSVAQCRLPRVEVETTFGKPWFPRDSLTYPSKITANTEYLLFTPSRTIGSETKVTDFKPTLQNIYFPVSTEISTPPGYLSNPSLKKGDIFKFTLTSPTLDHINFILAYPRQQFMAGSYLTRIDMGYGQVVFNPNINGNNALQIIPTLEDPKSLKFWKNIGGGSVGTTVEFEYMGVNATGSSDLWVCRANSNVSSGPYPDYKTATQDQSLFESLASYTETVKGMQINDDEILGLKDPINLYNCQRQCRWNPACKYVTTNSTDGDPKSMDKSQCKGFKVDTTTTATPGVNIWEKNIPYDCDEKGSLTKTGSYCGVNPGI